MTKAEEFVTERNLIHSEVDLKGQGIEDGVKNVCIGLSLNGFKTVQSCEGHFIREGRGLNFPWVDITIPFLHEHVLGVNIIDEVVLNSNDFQERYMTEGKLFLENFSKVLDKFYAKYPRYITDKFILKDSGAYNIRYEPELTSSDSMNEEKLPFRRKQIHDFGLFLIKKYFKSGIID
jgi:hypothetical protein